MGLQRTVLHTVGAAFSFFTSTESRRNGMRPVSHERELSSQFEGVGSLIVTHTAECRDFHTRDTSNSLSNASANLRESLQKSSTKSHVQRRLACEETCERDLAAFIHTTSWKFFQFAFDTMQDLGRLLLVLGALLIVAGLILVFAKSLPGLGRLPGDILIRRGNFTFYFPLATSLVLSLVLSLLLYLLGKR